MIEQPRVEAAYLPPDHLRRRRQHRPDPDAHVLRAAGRLPGWQPAAGRVRQPARLGRVRRAAGGHAAAAAGGAVRAARVRASQPSTACSGRPGTCSEPKTLGPDKLKRFQRYRVEGRVLYTGPGHGLPRHLPSADRQPAGRVRPRLRGAPRPVGPHSSTASATRSRSSSTRACCARSRSSPTSASTAVSRRGDSPSGSKRKLRASALIDRRRYLVIEAPDPTTLDERAEELVTTFRQQALTLERVETERELRQVVNSAWTPFAYPDRIGPATVMLDSYGRDLVADGVLRALLRRRQATREPDHGLVAAVHRRRSARRRLAQHRTGQRRGDQLQARSALGQPGDVGADAEARGRDAAGPGPADGLRATRGPAVHGEHHHGRARPHARRNGTARQAARAARQGPRHDPASARLGAARRAAGDRASPTADVAQAWAGTGDGHLGQDDAAQLGDPAAPRRRAVGRGRQRATAVHHLHRPAQEPARAASTARLARARASACGCG